MRTLLRNSTVVTMNSRREILRDCDLILDDDRIGAIIPGDSKDAIEADQVLSCKGKIIIPGLVSAHSHLTGIFQRGLWNESSFASWLAKSNATEEIVNLSGEDIYFLHCASCIEFLRHGVTTVLNMFTVRPMLDPEKMESALRAFQNTGIRGVLAVMLKDRSPSGDAIVGFGADESCRPKIREAARQINDLGAAVTFMLAPSAPQLCSDQLLISCRDLAAELKIGIHTHVAETKGHADLGRRLYGESIVKHLETIELLSPSLSIAHANWLDGGDVDVLKAHQVKVVHNPSANMKLGSGVARVRDMLNKGLTLGLGADSVNAGTLYSIFEQMKLSVLLPRICWGAENWVLPEEAFEMGTLGGAKALLLDKSVGSIEEGKNADIVILNSGTSLLPMNNLLSQLALSENGESVESVFVNGKPVLMNGRVQTIDEEYVLAKLASLTPRIQQAQKQASMRV
jgi:5-methylthioadenosine/S-adenosylhomocysteine deaminase